MARKQNYTADGEGKAVVPGNKDTKRALMSQAEIERYTTEEAEGIDASNIIIPRLAVLQGLSPQLDRNAPEYIKGAEIGMLCDVALGEVWDGKEGIYILPALARDIYLDWADRKTGEGLLANYGTDSRVYDSIPANEKMKHLRPDGSEVVKTGTIYCLNLSANGRPSFFPNSSTAYQAMKEFNTARLEDKLEVAPGVWIKARINTRTWHVTTKQREKAGNRWYVPVIRKSKAVFELPNGDALFDAAKQFAEQVQRGLVTTEFVREGDEETVRDREREAL